MAEADDSGLEAFIPLVGMLEMVAFKRGMRGIAADGWVQRIFSNFNDIGINTLHEFTDSVLSINDKLGRSGHRQLEAQTLNLMIVEVHDMFFGPTEEMDVGEPGRDRHLE